MGNIVKWGIWFNKEYGQVGIWSYGKYGLMENFVHMDPYGPMGNMVLWGLWSYNTGAMTCLHLQVASCIFSVRLRI